MKKIFTLLVALVCVTANSQQTVLGRAAEAAPSSLSYASPNVFMAGSAIPPLTPSVTGSVQYYSISPDLPLGMAIDPATGIISGIPTAPTPIATYMVTAHSALRNTTFRIRLSVINPVQSSFLSYPSPNSFTVGAAINTLAPTLSGPASIVPGSLLSTVLPTKSSLQNSYSIAPSLPPGLSINSSTGKITGTPLQAVPAQTYYVTVSNATSSHTFGIVIAVGNTPAPASLSYPSPNTFTAGTAVATLLPNVTGNTTLYSVSPSLPQGLTLNALTGSISGTPTSATSTATYTVTASNAGGSTTFGLVITVNPALQPPSSLSYPTPNTFTAGSPVSTLSPNVTGTVASYSVSPSLPDGLVLNASTGSIYGTPSSASSTATYTVTASNSAGSTSFAVVITVEPAAPILANVTYTASGSAIANPERGFYKHTETHSTGYYPLSQSALTSYRTNSNITLILRVFYLENFMNGPISSTYLQNMQTDFARIRAAGIKCIVRFAYVDHDDPGVPHDAPKAIVLSHINQLAPILQANSDVIAFMQAGFIGSWGEWYYTTHFGKPPTPADYANRKNVVDALLAAVPNRFIQIRTPALKMNTYQSTTALQASQAFTGAALARLGHHNDCFLASSTDYGTYNNPSTEYPYLEQETKFTPMGGETCAVNAPRSECTIALDEMAKFHWSYMNLDYHETVISEFQNDGCFSQMQNKMGYRFELVSGIYPTSGAPGSAVPVTFQIRNDGFATPYNARTAYLVFRNAGTQQEYRMPLAADVRFWNPSTVTTVAENVSLPANMAQGSYNLFLHLADPDPALANRPEYAIRLANNNTWEAATGYNNLNHTVTVSGSAVARQNERTEVLDVANDRELVLYPIPADGSVNIEMDSIDKSEIQLFNALGQIVSVPDVRVSSNKAMLDTRHLESGIYVIRVSIGDKAQTRRIIISH